MHGYLRWDQMSEPSNKKVNVFFLTGCFPIYCVAANDRIDASSRCSDVAKHRPGDYLADLLIRIFSNALRLAGDRWP